MAAQSKLTYMARHKYIDIAGCRGKSVMMKQDNRGVVPPRQTKAKRASGFSSRVAAILLAIVGVGLIGGRTSSVGPSSLLAALGLDARNTRSLTSEKRIAFDRPLHVLSLGGSVTWGAMNAGSDREDAYPFVLASEMLPPESTVTNIAVRGAGADQAAMCLQTMVLEGHTEQNPTVLDPNGGHDIDYDIITVEYSVNGIRNLDYLLRRLRQRYPRAIIIYIHLYTWHVEAVDEQSNNMLATQIRNQIWEDHDKKTAWEWGSKLFGNPSYQWSWRHNHDARWRDIQEGKLDTIQQDIKSIDGLLYELPMHNKASDALPWFCDDLHHLNEEGHKVVSEKVTNLIEENLDSLSFSKQEQSHGWGESNGDQCMSWYDSDKSRSVRSNRDIVMFSGAKYAMEVSMNDTDIATIEIYNPLDETMPLGLSTMAHKRVYPMANVTVSSVKGDFATLLDPFHRLPGLRQNHVVQSHFVGYAEPGRNVISISPVEITEEPLRITGAVMCKDCGLEEMVPSEQQ